MIESPRNARVQSLLRAVEAKELFVVEGEKLIADAAVAGFQFESVFHDPALKAGRLAAISRLRPAAVSREVLARFCDSRTPQHVVALARRREVSAAEVLAGTGPAVFLFDVQDPGNVGAVARVVEAVGGSGMIRSEGTADFCHPRALRSSAGSLLRLPVSSNADFEAVRRQAKSEARAVCATAGAGSEDLFAARLPSRALWVFGSEGAGLPAPVREAADRLFSIPMRAPVESLNIAVAAGIALFEAQYPRR
jgi:TrmH family RNA methyltransferase